MVDRLQEGSMVMLDAAFLGLTVVFFIVAVAYVSGCDRLGGGA